MRKYHQLTSGERYALSALRKQGKSNAEIARALGRHPSTISRELRRNAKSDGWYRPGDADDYARWRRSRSRRTVASPQSSGRSSWSVSKRIGAPIRSPDASSSGAFSPSVTRPSTATSGRTGDSEALSTFTSGSHPSSVANATAPTIPAAVSPANATSPNGHLAPRTVAVSVTSRATPSWALRRTGTALSPSSIARPVTS